MSVTMMDTMTLCKYNMVIFDEKCTKNYGILGCAISMWEDSDGFRLVQFYSMHLIFKN